jgi:hypothetical protein
VDGNLHGIEQVEPKKSAILMSKIYAQRIAIDMADI